MLVSNRTDLAVSAGVAEGRTSAGQKLVEAWRQGPGQGIDIALHDSLDDVAAVWRTFETHAEATVFQSFAWHAAWRAHIGMARGAQPVVVVGRRGGEVVFIAPLAIEKGRLFRRLAWHAGDMSDYNAALLAPEFAATLTPAAFADLFAVILDRVAAAFPFDAVFLDKMPASVGGAANPFVTAETELCADGAWRMPLGPDWESFYRDKRSSATRRKDRKKRAKLATFGEVRFERVTQSAEIAKTLETLFRQKTAWLAAVGAPDFFAKSGHRAFFAALSADPALRQAVHLSRLSVGEETVATAFAVVFHRTYYLIVLAYAQGPMTAWGPGAALLRDLIAEAIAERCTTFDFTIGDERFKQEWCETRATLHVLSAARTRRAVPAIALARWVAALKRLVKQNARLRDFAMAMRARLFRRGGRPQAPAEAGEDAENGADAS